MIDGKQAQIVTYEAPKSRKKFVAGLYVLINEARNGRKAALYMTVKIKNVEDLETAKQIFQSLRFDDYVPFTVEQ